MLSIVKLDFYVAKRSIMRKIIAVILFVVLCSSAYADNGIKTAGKDQIRRLNDYLKPGYAIVDTSKVYYKVSKDYKNAYFVGTMIISQYSGDLYPCMWIVNREDFNGVMFSANKYATETSYPMDANKTQMHVSTHADGYADVLKKVNDHFGALMP